jgi:hypothetical protein
LGRQKIRGAIVDALRAVPQRRPGRTYRGTAEAKAEREARWAAVRACPDSVACGSAIERTEGDEHWLNAAA